MRKKDERVGENTRGGKRKWGNEEDWAGSWRVQLGKKEGAEYSRPFLLSARKGVQEHMITHLNGLEDCIFEHT